MGDRRDGLYYFRQVSSVKTTSVMASSSVELWHKRLGHPSEKVVKLLPFVGRCKDHLDKACEVCHRAKQPRESFPLSKNKASKILELIHCDLWGPYNPPSSCGARYFL
ncbi:GAG-pre-integrase domain-containing protein, partial [Weizmannia coagulans]|nr:GAG-pre-integrase domain-containing protein [Heyndrickxia coagulans]